MIKHNDKKMTANEYAKEVVVQYGLNAEYFADTHPEEAKMMTEREYDEVSRLIIKHQKRLMKFFNY